MEATGGVVEGWGSKVSCTIQRPTGIERFEVTEREMGGLS